MHRKLMIAVFTGFVAFAGFTRASAAQDLTINPFPEKTKQEKKSIQQAMPNLLSAREDLNFPRREKPESEDWQKETAYRPQSLLEPSHERHVATVPEPVPVRAGAVKMPEKWRALRGQSIRETLMGWSQDAGVELVWNTKDAFAVLETLSLEATFEESVERLLDQYTGNFVRPVATLHHDQQRGQKTLVVETERG